MTDAQGKVLFDGNKVVGRIIRWNVWLTLRGQYGARSTAKDALPIPIAPWISRSRADNQRWDGLSASCLPVNRMRAMALVIKRSERRISVGQRRFTGNCAGDWRGWSAGLTAHRSVDALCDSASPKTARLRYLY